MKRETSARPPKAGRRYFMINVTLPHDLDEFLQAVGNEARRSGGFKLPKTLILRGLARLLRELRQAQRLDLVGVRTEEDFVERLRQAFGLRERR